MSLKLITLIIPFIVAGCQLQTKEMATNSLDYTLCSQVYVYGNTKYYLDEIKRRKLDCNKYTDALLKEKNSPGALELFANGIAEGQKLQQPPPQLNYIPPGVTRGTYMSCTPDGRGGYYCK